MKRTMALGALVALAGCAESPMQAKTPSAATDQQATCRAAKDPNNPLIVEWPGTSRTALSAASQPGLVVVSYSGCVMKVLQGCDARGRYQMKSAAASPERLVIDSEDMEYVAVGQQVADGEPLALQGGAACEGATHYVRAMTMGAFSLDATATRTVGGSAGAGGVGVSGDTRSGITNVSGGGDLAACKADPKSVRCDAVLQLSVAKRSPRRTQPSEGTRSSSVW